MPNSFTAGPGEMPYDHSDEEARERADEIEQDKLIAGKRYCPTCDEWVKGRECPQCGMETER